jgi:hypothetical protein
MDTSFFKEVSCSIYSAVVLSCYDSPCFVGSSLRVGSVSPREDFDHQRGAGLSFLETNSRSIKMIVRTFIFALLIALSHSRNSFDSLKKPLGVIVLVDVKDIYSIPKESCVALFYNQQTVKFKAKSPEECDEWIAVLRGAFDYAVWRLFHMDLLHIEQFCHCFLLEKCCRGCSSVEGESDCRYPEAVAWLCNTKALGTTS